MTLIQRFDTWASSGTATLRSLALYRIVYALGALVLFRPSVEWARTYPDSIYDPPFGPWRLFGGFPSYEVLLVLVLLANVALVALLVGWHTRVAAFAATLLMITVSGWTFSLGKIDHSILFLLVPAVLAPTGWGGALSVDALRRRARDLPAPPVQQWPLRLLALLVGLGFLTAGLAKARSWLSPDTHAVQGTLFRQFHVNDRRDLLIEEFMEIQSPVFWELIDVATIALECGLVLAALWWPAWRIGIAVAATFHLGVYLMMNIPFSGNLLVYAAFVPWERVPLPVVPVRWATAIARAAPIVIVVLATGIWLLGDDVDGARRTFGYGVVYAGGIAGAAYLATIAARVAQLTRR